MYFPRALKDRLTAEMGSWRLGREEHRALGGCSAEWVLTETASPSPGPSPGVWSAAKTRVSMCCSPAREDRLIAKKKLWVLTSPSSPPPGPSPGV